MVIGDPCPWVAQSAEAFLSKIFACSYSIAGLNVLSGNPADHLVHRHTHRVVRGSLLVCGRPDGRLTALTTLEASTCLAVNQASSIQSIGGTCESITIGHNMSKLPLSFRGIFLETHRPRFLCEKLLDDADADAGAGAADKTKNKSSMKLTATGNLKMGPTSFADSGHYSDTSTVDEFRQSLQNIEEDSCPANRDDEFLQSLMSLDESIVLPPQHDTISKQHYRDRRDAAADGDDLELNSFDMEAQAAQGSFNKQGTDRRQSSNVEDDLESSSMSIGSSNSKSVPNSSSWGKLSASINRGSSNVGEELTASFTNTDTVQIGAKMTEPRTTRRRRRTRNPFTGSLTSSIKRGSSNISDSNESTERSSASLLGGFLPITTLLCLN